MTPGRKPKFPFGRFRGRHLDDPQIPDSYIEQFHLTPRFELREWLRDALASEYKRRTTSRPVKQRIEPVLQLEIPLRLSGLASAVFDAGHSALAKQTNPDAGQYWALMGALNRLSDVLRRQLQGDA